MSVVTVIGDAPDDGVPVDGGGTVEGGGDVEVEFVFDAFADDESCSVVVEFAPCDVVFPAAKTGFKAGTIHAAPSKTAIKTNPLN